MVYKRTIFVFGSNLKGWHGKGAALTAKRFYGAIQGQGEGLQGGSYAIPTKITPYQSLPVFDKDGDDIHYHVVKFLGFAFEHPDWKFNVTRIGCGHAGYTDAQIAPLFRNAPENCILPVGWREMFKSGDQESSYKHIG